MNLLQVVRRLRQKRKIRSALNHVGRLTRTGNYWYWLDPRKLHDGIDIVSLISPLRYDVLLRRDFFSFYVQHRDLYQSDFDAFVRRVKETPYYTWFTKSEVVRARRSIRGKLAAVEVAFVEKVRDAVTLYESVTTHGFDRRFPIILKTAEKLLPPSADRAAPPTGKTVSGRFFLADGCHRLALWMSLGHTRLEPETFRVKCYRTFSPFDSTSLLARTLPIEPATYFEFLSMRYCAPQHFTQGDQFLHYIRESRPELLSEVQSIMQVDGFDVYLSDTVVESSTATEPAQAYVRALHGASG